MRGLGTRFFGGSRVPVNRRGRVTSSSAPIWGAMSPYSIFERTSSISQPLPVTVSDGGFITIAWHSSSVPSSQPTWITLSSGTTPTIAFTGDANQIDSADVSNMVLLATANGQSQLSPGVSITVSPVSPAVSSKSINLFSIPSLANETATYSLLGWTPSAGASTFNFRAVPGTFGTTNIHDDFEGDDLWLWLQQQRRGYGAGNWSGGVDATPAWVSSWLAYYKNQFYYDYTTDDPDNSYKEPSVGVWDHTFGQGLALYGAVNGDKTAIDALETLANFLISRPQLAKITNGTKSTGEGGGRDIARWLIVFCHLVQATGKAKWVTWRDNTIRCYMNSPDWQEYPNGGIVQGGMYFCDRNWMNQNSQNSGYEGNTLYTYATGDDAYDAGVRSNSVFMYGLHGAALIYAYRQTGRTDIANRIVKMARFHEYYAHDPAHAYLFTGGYFGHRNGSRWHRNNPGVSDYEASVIDTLVWGYKLSGTASLLTRAQTHLRQVTQWAQWTPPGTPLTGSTGLARYLDTSREHVNDSTDSAFDYNKGRLQYASAVFENGGAPTILPLLPYSVPTQTGQGILIGSNTANSIKPSTHSTSDWEYSLMLYYGGGAFVQDYSAYGAFVLAGTGGHGVPPNFGAAVFDFETGAWARIDNANGMAWQTNDLDPTQISSDGEIIGIAGNMPSPQHQYMNASELPSHRGGGGRGSYLMCWGTAGGTSGNRSALHAHRFDLETGVWSRYSTNRVSDVGAYIDYWQETPGSVLDPITGNYYGFTYRLNSDNPVRLNPSTQAWSSVSWGGGSSSSVTCGWFDPQRRAVLFQDENGPLYGWLVDTPSSAVQTLTVSGVPLPEQYNRGNRWAYSPSDDAFYTYPGTGQTIYKLTPPSSTSISGTWVCSTITVTGITMPQVTNPDPANPKRHYNRFFYVPRLDCMAWIASASSQVALIKTNTSSSTPSFTTPFGVDENPISEGGAWTQSATAWKDVRTTGGYATGASYITEGLYDDNYAKLSTSAFSATSDNYEVVATVRKLTEGVVANSEIEILLRVVDTSTTINCYEVLVNVGGSCELVRWNGTMGNFFEIAATSVSIPGWTGNGDKIKARVTGTNPVVVTVSHAPANNPTNFTQLFQYSDTDATRKQSGQPGIAFYAHAADNNLLNAGWQDFTVTAI